MGFRHSKLDPWWLKRGPGAKLLFIFRLAVDACTEHLYQGFFAGKPGKGTPTALKYIARDRGVLRGIDESYADFAVRLRRWLDDRKMQGHPIGLLLSLRGYCNADVRIRTVDRNGNWWTLERDLVITYTLRRENWNWDGVPASPDWARFWVIIYPTADNKPWGPTPYTIGSPSLWGGAIGTADHTIGTTATPQQVRDVQGICDEWKAPGRCERIIIAFDDASFDPAAAAGSAGMPDGDWGAHFTTSGSPRGPVRLSTARYWPGRRA
jgi:hypothetical protein